MNEFIIIAEIIVLAITYVLILHAFSRIHQAYSNRQSKPEVLSSEDDINIVSKEK